MVLEAAAAAGVAVPELFSEHAGMFWESQVRCCGSCDQSESGRDTITNDESNVNPASILTSFTQRVLPEASPQSSLVKDLLLLSYLLVE